MALGHSQWFQKGSHPYFFEDFDFNTHLNLFSRTDHNIRIKVVNQVYNLKLQDK